MPQWHRCKTTDLYEVRRAKYHEDANAGREAHRVIFRNANTKALVTPEMGEILYKRELDYWFTHWWSDGEWNSKPYYISQDQLASLMDANNCIRIPIDMGFFRTNIEIKLDRATLLRSNICIVSKQFLQEHFYKEQAEAKKIYDDLQSLNAQYLKDIHHWQNKYNLLKEEIEKRTPLEPIPPWVYNQRTGTFTEDYCQLCPTNPKNGGDGLCNCTLGTPKITC